MAAALLRPLARLWRAYPGWTLAVALASILGGSCVTERPRPPVQHLPDPEAPYLLEPSAGYPLAAAVELEQGTRSAWEALRRGEDLAAIEATVDELLVLDPTYQPAQVLDAQLELLRGDPARSVEILDPIAAELPDYLACQLLLGRAAEGLGDLPRAWDAYHRIAAAHILAAERAAELRSRALEIVARRVADRLDRGRVEDAERDLLWLLERAPEERVTLEAQLHLAVARNDPEAELAVVRRLAEEEPESEYVERLGDLEVEIGDVRQGLDILDRLARSHPDDSELAEKAARAKFLWRLQLQPEHVQEVARSGRLSRADFATLLYWLIPEVRYAQVSNPPIATDILDHPRREEIVRVMNLDLMTVDRTLHRFEPDEPTVRWRALAALLTLLERSDREVSCLTGSKAGDVAASRSLICRKAAQCRLIGEEADCLAGASLAGAEALDLFRRALDLLGSG